LQVRKGGLPPLDSQPLQASVEEFKVSDINHCRRLPHSKLISYKAAGGS